MSQSVQVCLWYGQWKRRSLWQHVRHHVYSIDICSDQLDLNATRPVYLFSEWADNSIDMQFDPEILTLCWQELYQSKNRAYQQNITPCAICNDLFLYIYVYSYFKYVCDWCGCVCVFEKCFILYFIVFFLCTFQIEIRKTDRYIFRKKVFWLLDFFCSKLRHVVMALGVSVS